MLAWCGIVSVCTGAYVSTDSVYQCVVCRGWSSTVPRATAVSSGSRDRHLGLGAMNRGIVDVRQRRQESFASEGWSLVQEYLV